MNLQIGNWQPSAERPGMRERKVIVMNVRQMRNEALGKRVVKALESRNMEA